MITYMQQLKAWNDFSAMRALPMVLFAIGAMLHLSIKSVNAQEAHEKSRWSVGFHAGALSGNLASASATNALVSRFNIENDYYLTAGFQAGYAVSEYESLYLTMSRSEFSVFTDYEFWPDIIIRNQFYSGNLSAQLDLRRFIGTLPNRLDPYGMFGLGLISSRNTIGPLDPEDTSQNDFSDNQSTDLSFLITTGFGLDYSLNSRVSIFFQFNYNFLSSDIIDKNLAGDILQNDFIQTTNKWSTYTGGFRLKFGKSRTRVQSGPQTGDFQMISTNDSDRLNELDEPIADLRDQIESSTESDTTAIETAISPEQADITLESETTDDISVIEELNEEEISIEEGLNEEEISNDEDLNDEEISFDEEVNEEEIPVSELNGLSDEDDNIIVTQPRYGLMGTVNEEIPGSYTINLHSFSEHNDADRSILLLGVEGFRVVTQIVNVNGVDYMRVGVGQFETRRDAQAAVQDLPESYRNNYFIVQISR